MTLKTMLFEIILTAVSIVGLYESWSYLNGANIEDYSKSILLILRITDDLRYDVCDRIHLPFS
ncbi:hypothetical protein DYY67_0887 [Candidatus Nitrosotalea sp. TS]|nr:hypothetical protein [Candidatus Nitrosotalea sp. TS]